MADQTLMALIEYGVFIVYSQHSRFITHFSQYVATPTSFAAFPHDLVEPPPIELAKINYNITHYALHKTGGHFAALEVPTHLAKHIHAFAKQLFMS